MTAVFAFRMRGRGRVWDQEVACSNHVAPTVSAVETNR